jgi:hypothetical protein
MLASSHESGRRGMSLLLAIGAGAVSGVPGIL